MQNAFLPMCLSSIKRNKYIYLASPAYSREGSASPEKSQEKLSAGPASKGGSPGARIDAKAQREEESAFNKQANILSDAREALLEIVNVDSDPEGPSNVESSHSKAGGNLDPAVETRKEKFDRLQREMQALIEQEDAERELLLNSSSSVVPEALEARRTPPISSPQNQTEKRFKVQKGCPRAHHLLRLKRQATSIATPMQAQQKKLRMSSMPLLLQSVSSSACKLLARSLR
jgi:hypothetical protein